LIFLAEEETESNQPKQQENTYTISASTRAVVDTEHIKLLFNQQEGKCAKCGAQLITFSLPINEQLFCPECYTEPEGKPNVQEYHTEPEEEANLHQQAIKENNEAYQWACLLTTEQKQDDYLRTCEIDRLLTRLTQTKGNLIAVIGMQGVGKTALKQAIDANLSAQGKLVVSIKWGGKTNENLTQTIREFADFGFIDKSDPQYLDALIDTLIEQAKAKDPALDYQQPDKARLVMDIAKRTGIAETTLLDYFQLARAKNRNEFKEHEARVKLWEAVPLLEKTLGHEQVEQIRQERFKTKMEDVHTLQIDLPDYDTGNVAQMNRDLANLQTLWETMFNKTEGIYGQTSNIIVFFQKELFHGHFLMKKFDVYEIQPIKPGSLTEYYKKRFGLAPFTEEALQELAVLSRGIFRRFKRYIRICLENSYTISAPMTISCKEVDKWISLDQIVKDMELELMSIFPREKELRYKTVLLLQFLREKGPTPQNIIAQEVFDGNETQTSRVLDRLESQIEWRYITRERVGRDKIVTLLQ
jgi:hypothetical protein